jgi:sugar diacid utilization regulator
MAVYRKLWSATQNNRITKKGRANSCIVEDEATNEAVVLIEAQIEDGSDAAVEWQSALWEDMEYCLCDSLHDCIAIGRFYPQLLDVASSLREAREAYAIGKALGQNRHCYPYTLWSVYSVLHNADPLWFDLGYVELLANTKMQASFDGVTTLETFIDCGSLKKAAEALFIHENTLRYRLQKISDLLHLDFNDALALQSMLMQIKLWRLKNNPCFF